jgi:hypothetical protein
MKLGGRQITDRGGDEFVKLEDAHIIRVDSNLFKAWLRNPIYNPEEGNFFSVNTDLGQICIRPRDFYHKS